MLEMAGSALSAWHYPRYTFFLHFDEESLESVVDDAKARERGGYFCKIVRGEIVLVAETEREEVRDVEGEEQKEEEMEGCEYELRELRKKVKINALVGLYVALQLDSYKWYLLPMDEGIALA
jgi:hypothetical protein